MPPGMPIWSVRTTSSSGALPGPALKEPYAI
nr:MAG TPA: hypothetical protein [Caudoviricetes sp.]